MIPKLYHAVILLNLLHSLNIVDYTQNDDERYSFDKNNHGNQSNWSFVQLTLSDQQGIPSNEYLLPDKYHATTTEKVLENQSVFLKPHKMTFNQSYLEDLLTYTSQYLAIIPESIITQTGNFTTTLLIFTNNYPTTTKIPQIFSLILSFLYSIIFYYFTKQVYNSWYSSSSSGLKSVKTWFYLVWLFMVLYHDTMGSATYLAHAYSNLSYDWIDKNSNSIWISFQDVPSLSPYDIFFCLSILLNLILIASLRYKSYHRISSIRVTQNGSIPKLTVTNSVHHNQNILLNREHHQQPILINHQSNCATIHHHENEDQLDGSLVDHNQNETESTISSSLTCSSFVCDRLLVSHTNRFQSFQDRLRASSSSYLSTLESVSDSGDHDDEHGKENLLEQEEIDDCELPINNETVE